MAVDESQASGYDGLTEAMKVKPIQTNTVTEDVSGYGKKYCTVGYLLLCDPNTPLILKRLLYRECFTKYVAHDLQNLKMHPTKMKFFE